MHCRSADVLIDVGGMGSLRNMKGGIFRKVFIMFRKPLISPLKTQCRYVGGTQVDHHTSSFDGLLAQLV